MVAALTEQVSHALAAGDHEAARIAHEALGRLIGSAATEPAKVVSIDRARKR